jgi:putative DNA methylase
MKRKLIEVALPLDAINKEAAREKSIRHGHPSTLHLWWARRPLAACRAVLFASLVDDPSSHPDEFPTEADQDRERQRLFRLIEELVKWENSNNKQLLEAAHLEILKSTDGHPPSVYDPFCGGGSIPLEAQRLGLEGHGSDLNPVAVLITKAMIEIPPKFANKPPVHPMARGRVTGTTMWEGAHGLGDDVRYYGQWMREQAFERIGHLYPNLTLSREQGGGEAVVIAWLWARTVLCPNPACGAQMPLARSFALSMKQEQKFWVEPQVDLATKAVRFLVRSGKPTPSEMAQIQLGTSAANAKGKRTKALFRCVVCRTGIADGSYIDACAGMAQMGQMPLAIVCESAGGRIYVEFTGEKQTAALAAAAQLLKEPPINSKLPLETSRGTFASNAQGRYYGFFTFKDYFTQRQLVTLTTFSDLIVEGRERAMKDGADEDYANAIATYLAFAVDKGLNLWSSLASWMGDRGAMRETFARQGLSMTWDYAEANPFSDSGGSLALMFERVSDAIVSLPARIKGVAQQLDATAGSGVDLKFLFCTDPPYYDNISYADLSDFFYVWLRRSLGGIYPQLFSTLLVPKTQELVATSHRFGGSKERAQEFFEKGFEQAFIKIRNEANPDYPITVFYAFKQSEADDDQEGDIPGGVASTGWETMLEGLLKADFAITGTWPMRTEGAGRIVARGANALASSIVLVCRPRLDSAAVTTRKDFLASLKKELPRAVRDLQKGNIAPVDLAQALIGPGMAVFSRYRKVLESDGSQMRVRTALGLINQTLDEVLSEQEGEFDPDTRWALAWFEQHAFDEGLYGEAEVLATAKALSVSALDETKILHSRAGKVRLVSRDELSEDWNPAVGHRLTVWAVTQHLIRSLDKNGETATSALANKVGGLAETARDLAYRLYVLCERKGWAEEAGYYNSLVVSWPAIAPKTFALS